MKLRYVFMFSLAFMVSIVNDVNCAGLNTKKETSKKEVFQLSEDAKIKQLFKQHKPRINWSKELDLDKEQKVLVEKIYDNNEPRIDDLINQIKIAQEKIKEIYQKEDEEISQILNESQKFKFDKIIRRNKIKSGEKVEGEKPSRKRMRLF